LLWTKEKTNDVLHANNSNVFKLVQETLENVRVHRVHSLQFNLNLRVMSISVMRGRNRLSDAECNTCLGITF
jgi:hypothetical protein